MRIVTNSLTASAHLRSLAGEGSRRPRSPIEAVLREEPPEKEEAKRAYRRTIEEFRRGRLREAT